MMESSMENVVWRPDYLRAQICQRNRVWSEYTDFLKSNHIIGDDGFWRGGSWGQGCWSDWEDSLQNCACWYHSVSRKVRKHRLECLSLAAQINSLTTDILTPYKCFEMFWFHKYLEMERFCSLRFFSQVRQFILSLAPLCLYLNQAISIKIIHPEIMHVERASKHNE